MNKNQDSELNEIIEGFQILGSDSGGLVNPNELKEIMDIMNMGEKNPYIYDIILALCSDEETQQKGGIEASDFISLLDQNLNDTSSKGGIQKIFSVFSNSLTNKISMPVFSNIIGDGNSFGEDGEKIKKLITKPEINVKELNFNEFHDIVRTETPRQSLNEHIIYKKKQSLNNKKYKFNEENNKNINNDINNIGINFNNNVINNNNYNNTNLRDSLDSDGKNSEKYNYKNNDSPNINEEFNKNQKYYKQSKPEKLYINTNIINNQRNNNIDMNNDNDNEVNNFDNINIEQEKKGEEVIITKKKYRHMRKSKNKDSPKDKYEERYFSEKNKDDINNNDEEEKDTYISNINKNKYTKGRIDNNDSEDKSNNNINVESEEKIETKSERRYHRRYRDVKSSTPDKKDDKIVRDNNNGENNGKISGHSRYRKNK
jgi:Ca2+-binding EF-hand superfamily protein